MRFVSALIATGISVSGITWAAAQHDHHSHDDTAVTIPETRKLVTFPAPLIDHTMANMRDHLQAVQEIQSHLGRGHFDVAAKIAETRLGMSSLGLHGAEDVAQFMPQGMQDAGTAMHRAASRFALVVQDAAITGDLKPVFIGLSGITGACVACHAGYRLR
jgi:hypothetical protein